MWAQNKPNQKPGMGVVHGERKVQWKPPPPLWKASLVEGSAQPASAAGGVGCGGEGGVVCTALGVLGRQAPMGRKAPNATKIQTNAAKHLRQAKPHVACSPGSNQPVLF